MRFHREALWEWKRFKPLSHDRDLGCHWEWKIPTVLYLSLWKLMLFASICQSVTDCDVQESDPAPHWPYHIPFSIYPSIQLSIPSCFSHWAFKCLSLHFLQASPSTPLCSGRHRNGWFRKGGWVSQSSCCSAPCGAFTVHFCFFTVFMALICWQFRWLSEMLDNCINDTKTVCSVPS